MREIKFRAWDGEAISFPLTIGDIVSGHLDWNDENPPILMQYTGLKDKNGKEIYEGDVVKYISPEFVGKVCYTTYGGRYELEEKKGGTIYHHNFLGNEVEIIGNIYENPNLKNNE